MQNSVEDYQFYGMQKEKKKKKRKENNAQEEEKPQPKFHWLRYESISTIDHQIVPSGARTILKTMILIFRPFQN